MDLQLKAVLLYRRLLNTTAKSCTFPSRPAGLAHSFVLLKPAQSTSTGQCAPWLGGKRWQCCYLLLGKYQSLNCESLTQQNLTVYAMGFANTSTGVNAEGR